MFKSITRIFQNFQKQEELLFTKHNNDKYFLNDILRNYERRKNVLSY